MNRIYIKGLEIFAYHGVNPEEKSEGQRFVVDTVIHADLTSACRSDNLADTVNYALARKIITAEMTERSFDLIERAAYAVAKRLICEMDKIERVDILLKKPDAPMNAKFEYVAVELSLGRDDLGESE